jgi:hypothetical protein
MQAKVVQKLSWKSLEIFRCPCWLGVTICVVLDGGAQDTRHCPVWRGLTLPVAIVAPDEKCQCQVCLKTWNFMAASHESNFGQTSFRHNTLKNFCTGNSLFVLCTGDIYIFVFLSYLFVAHGNTWARYKWVTSKSLFVTMRIWEIGLWFAGRGLELQNYTDCFKI